MASIATRARELGRPIDDDHFGAMVFYTHDEIPPRIMELLAARNPEIGRKSSDELRALEPDL